VALSGGSSENTEPDAGAKIATKPAIVRSGKASTEIVAVSPQRASEGPLKGLRRVRKLG
jgi:hypothetical protein